MHSINRLYCLVFLIIGLVLLEACSGGGVTTEAVDEERMPSAEILPTETKEAIAEAPE